MRRTHGDGNRCVRLLEIAAESEFDVIESSIARDLKESGLPLLCTFVQNLQRRFGLGCSERGHTLFEYAGLVPGNAFDGITKHRSMVDTQAGHGGRRRLDQDVGAVVFATDATL